MDMLGLSPVEARKDEQDTNAQDAQEEAAWTGFVQFSEQKAWLDLTVACNQLRKESKKDRGSFSSEVYRHKMRWKINPLKLSWIKNSDHIKGENFLPQADQTLGMGFPGDFQKSGWTSPEQLAWFWN